MKFKSDIEVQAGLRDSSGSIGTSGQVLSSTGSNVSWINQNEIAHTVSNEVKAGVAINKGQAVYVTGADGTNIVVGLASNTSEATSSKTLGLIDATVAINGFANVVEIGRLAGLNTIGANTGDPVWLGVNGNLIYGLANKPYAPAHLVFIGIVTRVNANNGEIFVNVQNGFELKEIHDVDIITNVPINGDVLGYDGTLWVNKTIAEWLGYTPAPASGSANYIQNQNASAQSANMWISGSAYIDSNVGIGTATTSGRLTLSNPISDGSIPLISIRDTSNVYEVGYLSFSQSTDIMTLMNKQSYSSSGIVFGTNNAEKMRITVAGNVGIGTSAPNAKLEVSAGQSFINQDYLLGWNVAGSSTLRAYIIGTSGNELQFWNRQGGTNTQAITLNASGNVGIGTSSPGQKLEVNGNIISSINGKIGFRYSSSDANLYSYLRSATNGGIGPIVLAGGFESNGGTNEAIRFSTNNGSGGERTAVSILNVGNVGIGTSAPSFPFGSGLEIQNGVAAYLKLKFTGNTGFDLYQSGLDSYIFNRDNGFINFGTNNSEKMRITNAGNVGIGTSSPNSKLSISYSSAVVDALNIVNTNTNGRSWYVGDGAGVVAGTFGFYDATAALSRLVINASGNVGIGATSPVSIGTGITTLDIQGSAAGGIAFGLSGTKNYIYGASTMYVEANTTAVFATSGSEKMRITSAGNVGIGTTSPNEKLTVSGKIYANPQQPVVLSGQGAPYYGTNITLASDIGSTQGANRIWSRYDGTGSGATTFERSTNSQAYNSDPQLLTYTESMRIAGNGNVLIGTTSDLGYKLNVAGTLRTTDYALLGYNTSVGNSSFAWGYPGAYYGQMQNISSTVYGIGFGSTPTTIGTTVLSYNTSGNVGIGTTNPGYKLEVNGKIYSSTEVQANTAVMNTTGGYASFGSNSGSVPVRIGRDTSINDIIINAEGNVGIGTASINSALSSTEKVLKISNTNVASIYLETNGGAIANYLNSSRNLVWYDISASAEHMRLSSSGNLGIGTTSPAAKLTVVGAATVIGQTNVSARFSDDQNSTLLISHPDASSNTAIITGNNQLGFATGSVGSIAERMRIASNGAIKFNNYGSGTFTGTATQKLAVDSSGNIIEIPIGAGPVDGSGTTNYVTKWTDSDTIGNSLIYDNGTNVGIGTTSPNYKLDVNGTVNIVGTFGNRGVEGAYRLKLADNGGTANDSGIGMDGYAGGGEQMWFNSLDGFYWATGTYGEKMRITQAGNVGIGTSAPARLLELSAGEPTLRFNPTSVSGAYIFTAADGKFYFTPESTYVSTMTFSSGNVGIGTTSPNKTLTLFGTSRHERSYGYGNNVFQFANDVPINSVWLHLGTCSPFTTDKIYYRVNTNTSEEEGEITISNTCAFPFIQWQRNTYSPMVTEVKARMTGGCGSCEVWVLVNYGSNYGGANTTIQWQPYNGTDYGFTVVNTVGTPGTGTNEKSIVGSTGYFYANSGDIFANGNVGIGTTSPSEKLNVAGNISIVPSTGSKIGFNTTDAFSAYGTSVAHYGMSYGGGANFTALSGYFGLGFFTGGTEKMRIEGGGGFVGIGTSSPSQKLDVNGVAKANAFVFNAYSGSGNWQIGSDNAIDSGKGMYIYNSLGDYRISIKENGNIGIGTTSPTQKLEVIGTSYFSNDIYVGANKGIFFSGNGAYNTGIYSSGGDFLFQTSGVEKMRLDSAGNVGIGTTAPSWKLQVETSDVTAAMFRSNSSATILGIDNSAADGDPQLKFYINDIGTFTLGVDDSDSDKFKIGTSDLNTNTRLTIDGSGNVGIGTTTPIDKFHVVGGITSTGLADSLDGNVGSIQIGYDGTNGVIRTWYSSPLIYSVYAHHRFDTNGSERMRITNTGNVGIGTSSPSSMLTLNGTTPYIRIERSGVNTWQIQNNYLSVQNGFSVNNITAGTTPFFIGENGNVGIGTTSPGSKLDVNGTFSLLGGAGGYWLNGVQGNSTPGGNSPFLALVDNNTISSATYGWLFYDSNADGSFNLYRRNGSTTGNQVLTISRSTGNVGIGTTSPNARLDIVSTATGSEGLRVDGATGGFAFVVRGGGDYTSHIRAGATIGVNYFTTPPSNGLIVEGNVGIGTTTPSTNLEVVGTSSSVTPSIRIKQDLGPSYMAMDLICDLFAAAGIIDVGNYGNTIFRRGSSESMRIDGDGYIGINTSTPNARLHLRETNQGQRAMTIQINEDPLFGCGLINFENNSGSNIGSIFYNGSSTSYNTSSDYRLKENVVKMDGALERLKLLKPVNFNFINKPGTVVDGFIAHEVQEVIPEAIVGVKDELDKYGKPKYQGIDHSKIVPLLTAALQEAIDKISQLEERIQKLENK